MAQWNLTSVGDVAIVGAGNSAPQDKLLFERGTYPFVRTSDVGKIKFGNINSSVDLLNEEGIKKLKLFPANTILFPKSGASTFLNHRVALSRPAYVASHLATIIPDESKVQPRFLLYYLSTVLAQNLIQDHKYPSLKRSHISEIALPLPSLPEQKRIVAILDQAFQEIDQTIANTEKNLTNAKEIFESYLNDVFTRKGEGWVEKKWGEKIKVNHLE